MRGVGRVLLALALLVAGVAHLVDAEEFLGQVPTFLPLRLPIVYVSGVMELALAGLLVALQGDRLARFGVVVAVFFVAIFPGNLWQYVSGSNAFGLDSDRSRLIRLFFQPLLVAWALWATRGWTLLRRGR